MLINCALMPLLAAFTVATMPSGVLAVAGTVMVCAGVAPFTDKDKVMGALVVRLTVFDAKPALMLRCGFAS